MSNSSGRSGPGSQATAAKASGLVLVTGTAVVAYFLQFRGAGLAAELQGPQALDLTVVAGGIALLAILAHVLVAAAIRRASRRSRWRELARLALEVDLTDGEALRSFDSEPALRDLVAAYATEKAHARELSDRVETVRGEVDALVNAMRRSAQELARLREDGAAGLGVQVNVLWNGLVERVRQAEAERDAAVQRAAMTAPVVATPSPASDLGTLVERLDELEVELERLRAAVEVPIRHAVSVVEHVAPERTPPEPAVESPALLLDDFASPAAEPVVELSQLALEPAVEAPVESGWTEVAPVPGPGMPRWTPSQSAATTSSARDLLLPEGDEAFGLAPTPAAPTPNFVPRPAPAPSAPASPDGMRFPSFTRAAGPAAGDRVELTYETPSEEVLDLPAGALLFEGEPETAAERREFDLRTLGPTEFDR